MHLFNMPIDGGGRLCAAVTLSVIEIERGDSVIAENALEGDATAAQFGRVIAHT